MRSPRLALTLLATAAAALPAQGRLGAAVTLPVAVGELCPRPAGESRTPQSPEGHGGGTAGSRAGTAATTPAASSRRRASITEGDARTDGHSLALELTGHALALPRDRGSPSHESGVASHGSCDRMRYLRPLQPRVPQAEPQPSTPWAIALSALLPGAGQAALDVDRSLPYLAVEMYSWIQYVTHSRDSRRERNAYRDLAARVARAPFALTRPTGNFEYYERMEHFLESGVFDAAPGGALDPESDTATYNGSVWLLARRTYWPDVDVQPDTASAEWKNAIEFYERRAYDQTYRWSWRNAQLEYDAFRRLIRRSNESNRKSLQDLGIIIANHVLSTVDAYITVRLRQQPPSQDGGWAVEASVPLSLLRW